MSLSRRQEFKRWIRTRPVRVRQVARTLKPFHLLRHKETGQVGRLLAYSNDGTVRCVLWHEWSPEFTRVNVFGINPASLERAKPSSDEWWKS